MPAQNIDVVLRLLNGRRFNMAMNQSAASVRSARAEMEGAAASASGLGAAGNAATAGLFALSGATRLVTYGVGAMAAATIGMGISFNATMESNQLALEHFAGGADQARVMTKNLFDIAKNTPFSFADITTAARSFLTYGFNVKDATDHLKVMGDVLSYVGGNATEMIPLFVKAVGQIRSMHRLRQQEVNQLMNLKIPVFEAFTKGGLDLTEKQLKNIGRAGIDSDTALDALFKGLQKIYGGGSRKYLETFTGQWQRLKDNMSQAAGQSTTGIFGSMKDGLKAANDAVENHGTQISGTLKTVFEGTFMALGAAFLFIKDRVKEFMVAIGPAAPFFSNVLGPILKGFLAGVLVSLIGGWKLFIIIVRVVAVVLGFLGRILKPFKPVFYVIGYALSFLVGFVLKAAAFLVRLGSIFRLLGYVIYAVVLPFRLFGSLFSGLFKLFGFGIGFVGRFIKPIGILVKVFRDLGNIIWTNTGKAILWIESKLGKFGPKFFDIAVKMKNEFIRGLKGMAGAVLGLFTGAAGFAGKVGRGIADWLNDHTIFGDAVNLGPFHGHIPKLAGGGYIAGGGYAMVGERGPEMVHLPSGASVIPGAAARVRRPNQQSAQSRGEVFAAQAPSIIKVYIGRRQVAEAVGEEMASRRARG
jgi:hypothetical protein